MAAIEIQKLTKKYGQLTALDAVDLVVEHGESFGLLGPNGAGKTTLISILSTLTKATSGHATLAGLDVASQQAKVRGKIGIVFQDQSLDDRLSARENLMLHCSLYGVPLRKRPAQVDWALDLVELKSRQHNMVRTFSGGMRRRLELARCLVHTPEVLFLDEPTVGLDPQTRDHIWTYLQRLVAEHGITTVLTTHYMDEANRLCGRVAIIDFGRILTVDTPENLKKSMGDNIVTLETDRPRELLEVLGLTPEETRRAITLPDRLTLNVTWPEKVLSNAFRLGEDLGIKVKSVSISRPTLNDVFLKLTGHELREEKAQKNFSNFMRLRAGRTR